jgi:hypothetical protein
MSTATDQPATGPYAGPLDVLGAAVDALAAVPAWRASGPQLLTALIDVDTVEASLAAVRLALVAAVDTRGAAVATGAATTGTWLRAALRRETRAARREVRLAKALTEHPQVREALATGRITQSAAQAVTDALRALPTSMPAGQVDEAEATLVADAQLLDADGLTTTIRHLRYVTGPDAARALQAEERRQQLRRELHVYPVGDGWVGLHGHLDAEAGAKLLAALDPLTTPTPSTTAGPDPRSPARRTADALITLVEMALRAGHLPSTGGAPTTLLLTVPLDTRTDHATTAGILPTGQPISPGALRRLACDAAIIPAVLGGDSQPLDLGRTRYTCSPHLRKALILRDGGCARPGCHAPWTWTDAHHITHWAHHGPTTLDNLVLLCGRHHRDIHDPHTGWTITATPTGPPHFHPPPWHPTRTLPTRQ